MQFVSLTHFNTLIFVAYWKIAVDKFHEALIFFYRKQESQDIREILAGGTISDSELQYLELLGSGSAGTVYK